MVSQNSFSVRSIRRDRYGNPILDNNRVHHISFFKKVEVNEGNNEIIYLLVENWKQWNRVTKLANSPSQHFEPPKDESCTCLIFWNYVKIIESALASVQYVPIIPSCHRKTFQISPPHLSISHCLGVTITTN